MKIDLKYILIVCAVVAIMSGAYAVSNYGTNIDAQIVNATAVNDYSGNSYTKNTSFGNTTTLSWGRAANGSLYPEVISSTGLITRGTYVGNASANRSIPHGLGVEPKHVTIIGYIGTVGIHCELNNTRLVGEYSGTLAKYTVTAWDAQYFYVGNGAVTAACNNDATATLEWTAWG